MSSNNLLLDPTSMDQKDIGVKFLMSSAWGKHEAKELDSAHLMYSKAFDVMKEAAIESMTIQVHGGESTFDTMPPYNRLTEAQFYSMLFCCGLIEMDLSNYDDALHFFQYCKTFDPQRIVAYVYSALVHVRLGRDEQAFEEIYQAIHEREQTQVHHGSKDMDLSDLHCVLAVLYHRRRDMQSAIRETDVALQINPNNVMAFIIKGDSLKYREKAEGHEELKVYQKALQLDRKNCTKFIGLGFLDCEGFDWLAHFRSIFQFFAQSFVAMRIDGTGFWNDASEAELRSAFDSFSSLFVHEVDLDRMHHGMEVVYETDDDPDDTLAIQDVVTRGGRVRPYSAPSAPQRRKRSGSLSRTKEKGQQRQRRRSQKRQPTALERVVISPARNYSKPWLENVPAPKRPKKIRRRPLKQPDLVQPARHYRKPWLEDPHSKFRAKHHSYKGLRNQTLYSSIQRHTPSRPKPKDESVGDGTLPAIRNCDRSVATITISAHPTTRPRSASFARIAERSLTPTARSPTGELAKPGRIESLFSHSDGSHSIGKNDSKNLALSGSKIDPSPSPNSQSPSARRSRSVSSVVQRSPVKQRQNSRAVPSTANASQATKTQQRIRKVKSAEPNMGKKRPTLVIPSSPAKRKLSSAGKPMSPLLEQSNNSPLPPNDVESLVEMLGRVYK